MSARPIALTALLVVAAAGPTAGFAPLPFPRVRDNGDLRAMQGEWEAVSYTFWHAWGRGGQPVREEVHGMRARVEGGRISFTLGDDGPRWHLFRLGGPAGRRWIDSDPVTALGRPGHGREGDRWKRAGIYRLDGDTLTVCDAPEGERPEDFTGGHVGERLIVLKRVRPRP
jgi:uncharacterized protein (TIGR03067 family)